MYIGNAMQGEYAAVFAQLNVNNENKGVYTLYLAREGCWLILLYSVPSTLDADFQHTLI